MPDPLTPELLIERGYRRWRCTSADQWCNLADELFQKKIGDRYFVNIFRYRQNHSDGKDGWQPEVQLITSGLAFNVTLCSQPMSLDEIESFFARLYERMECEPYGE